ncbi:cellulose biosynthesis protein BcsG [Edwardsiella anguillarum]|uniref:cellulose biosynthesis protein BcsG n=1 Tax=Edwardsiella anguillarum TaxID=1821960 RepID=UPI0024B6BDA7|nr:cellulose biosynthesis protein BcsG [Edwardsiella anguillarum]WHP80196.1 cellulose biosynthesis protein BcsG [Edwardsiella anguillarum]WHQ17656.1 cellulose biosynthesis protein BcsG [Edwardsiella anguillarum]WHQ21193.1 cellulose biosynthesis protein BcsG [Edwardsiella anguillarum]WHQ24717.1 cellulose biosynthesis protein BcsG [Edwardsiella anguillarum]WHQ28282.1 cellulose biosynthesis protein BcsG [Edwardsiella anguillarum]
MAKHTEQQGVFSERGYRWRGLGGWNLYFLLKLALLWYGYLNFHPFANIIFLAFLLFPLPSAHLHRWRSWLAIPIGVALFYHDTWLPGLNSIVQQRDQWSHFSAAYAWDLTLRFINWTMIGAALVITVAYLFLTQWIRITTFTILALVWVNLGSIGIPQLSLQQDAATAVPPASSLSTPGNTPISAVSAAEIPAQSAAPNNSSLNDWLDRFYASEQQRQTHFPTALPADAQPFDLLIINICSLSWSDINAIGLQDHPLWKRMDILFNDFNSATAYSGPASIRLLRASCGQPSHKALYTPASQQCDLMENLGRLGFQQQLTMDHSGKFGDYLNELRQYAALQPPLASQADIDHELTAFDGEPIFNDLEILQRWLGTTEKLGDVRTASFVNLIALHDGNRFINSDRGADFKPRAQNLLDQLNGFLDDLERSGRRVMVVIVPEHGAAVVGDKMQMAGLRDIPSMSITHVPVGVIFSGMKAPAPASPVLVDRPSSYLALSELVVRSLDGKIFTQPSVDWQALVSNLPQSAAVSENDNAIVMMYQGKPYVRLNGGDWVPYPQ